jgi:hypothetical protein
MATIYLIELRLEQKEMLLFLDQNPNFKHSIMAVTDDAETGKKWPAPAEAPYKPARAVQRRKRRTKAQIEADNAMAKAAE